MLIAPLLSSSLNYLLRRISAQQTQGRFASIYRANCSKEKPPRCSKENLAKTKCMKNKGNNAAKKSIFHQFMVKPECCLNPCPDVYPPFDDLYYVPSDKAKRRYEQTWVECPNIKIKPKEMCCFEKLNYPKQKKRKFKPNTACVTAECIKAKGKCIKIVLPGCKKVRDPPKCLTLRKPALCKKKCTPYPSYSECEKGKTRALRPVECNCLNLVAMCDVYRALKKMERKRR